MKGRFISGRKVITATPLRVCLIKFAMAEEVTYYLGVYEVLVGEPDIPKWCARDMSPALQESDSIDMAFNLPDLSSLVCRKNEGIPSLGYFLGKLDVSSMTPGELKRFVRAMQERVFEHYSNPENCFTIDPVTGLKIPVK